MGGYLMGVFTSFVLLEFRACFADRGPVYMESSPDSVVVPINDETVLTCEMNIQPDGFQWRHYPLNPRDASNPKTIIYLGNATSRELDPSMFQIEKKKSTLKIKSSNESVAGDYQCLAHYGASVVASVPGRITITDLKTFPPQKSIQVTVTAGNTVSWRCDPPESNPPAFIDYYKGGSYVNFRPSLPTTKSLIIPNVNTSDSGIYSCVANNIIQQTFRNGDFSLNLKVVNNGPAQPPRFVIPPKKFYTVNAGEAVFMECAAVGTPIPKVVWYKSNGQLPINRTEMLPEGLLIFNVTSSDDGVYVCNHSNTEGALSHHITLVYNEAPSVIDGPKNTDIKEGENLDLECIVKGTPEPYISWFINGKSAIDDTNVEAIGNRIYFRPVQKKHAGIIQCFASNIVGTVYSSGNIKVIPKQISSADVADDYMIPHPTASNHKKRKKNRKNKGRKGTSEMIPPSKPTISRLNDESVMVRWTVPENNGLPIQFFKVQYRELGPTNHTGTHKGSKWKTTNTDIAPHIRSYEINNLKPDHAYRFRIAAVYSNNDNKPGPNSAKFYLNRADFFLRNPLPVPRLTHTETVSDSAIRIYWEYTPSQNVTVDGFYVNYIPADSASDYMKATVEGEDQRSYVIRYLQPDTAYDIKLQSFNTKSASEFSPILKQKTAPKEASTVPPVQTSSKPSIDTSEQTKMFIMIGAGVGGVALLLSCIILLIVCRKCKQKKEKSSRDERGVDKDDVSHHIQVDPNDYVVSPKSLYRANGCAVQPNRITITPNPLADADNKNQNMIEMSCLSSQNNNCSQPSASTQEPTSGDESLPKNKIRNKSKIGKHATESSSGENYV